MTFEIEDGIDMPPRAVGGAADYPLAQMTAGQSFYVPADEALMAADYDKAKKQLRNRIMSAITRHRKTHPASTFSQRMIEDSATGTLGVRVWCVTADGATPAPSPEPTSTAPAAAPPPPPPPPKAKAKK